MEIRGSLLRASKEKNDNKICSRQKGQLFSINIRRIVRPTSAITPSSLKGTAMSKHGTTLPLGQFVEFSGAVVKALPRDIDSEVALQWAQNGAALAKVLRKSLCPPARVDKTSTLVLHKKASLGGSNGKKTRDCFSDNYWVNRGVDIDRWLPWEQVANDAGFVGVYQLQNPVGTTFREMALAVVGWASEVLSNQLDTTLKGRGHTLTLPEVESLVERQQGGEDVGLRTDRFANFAFVEDANGSVSVLGFNRLDYRWSAGIHMLGDRNDWDSPHRLLVRNSDIRAL